MDYIDYLNDNGIHGLAEGKDNYRIPCFSCGSNDNISVKRENGAFKCWSCEVKGTFAKLCRGHNIPTPNSFSTPSIQWNNEWDNDRAIEYATHRSLRGHISFGYDEEGEAIVFPYKDTHGSLRGVKHKFLNGSGYKAEGECTLYIPSPEKFSASDEVHVTEGEIDAESLHQFGLNAVATGGTPNETQIELLKKFNKVWLCFDTDDAGKKFTEKVRGELREKTLVISYPYKDPNEFLQAGGTKEEWMEYQEGAESYESPTVVPYSNLLAPMKEFLLNKDLVMGEPTGFPTLDEILGGGLRLSELTVLLAEAKTGKNKLLHKIILNFLNKNIPIGYASRELSGSTEVLPNLFSIQLQKNMLKEEMTDELMGECNKTCKDWKLYFAEGYGEMSIEDFNEWINSLYLKGVRYFFFDHLHYALADPEDHKEAAKLIRNVKAMCKEKNIHFFTIIQPNKLMDGQKLSINAIKGGSSMGQALDNLLTFKRIKKDKNITKLELDKARSPLAHQGEHLHLGYNRDTMDLLEVCWEEDIDVVVAEDNFTKMDLNKYDNEKN